MVILYTTDKSEHDQGHQLPSLLENPISLDNSVGSDFFFIFLYSFNLIFIQEYLV